MTTSTAASAEALPERAQLVIMHLAYGFGLNGTAASLQVGRTTVQRMIKAAAARLGVRENKQTVLVDVALRKHAITLPSYPPVPLAPNQVDILELVAAGYSNAEIAVDQGLTLDAVKYRLQVIWRQLEAWDRVHAVAMGWQRGILGNPRPPLSRDARSDRETAAGRR